MGKEKIFQIKAPEVGESINEITIGTWLKKNNDFVERDEVLCEIESEKATLELTAETSGRLEILVPEGETVTVGTPIANIHLEEAAESKGRVEKESTEEPVVAGVEKEQLPKRRISPVARRIIEEKHIDPNLLEKIPLEERITRKTLESVLAKEEVPASKSGEVIKEREKSSAQATERGERRERMSTLRRTIAKHLVKAKQSTAMLTTFNEVDMGEIIRIRKEFQEEFTQKHGIRLGFMSFFVKAATIALMEFPQVNARIDGEDIVFHDYVDMGIAVSTDKGLVVPVVRNTNLLSLAEIEREVQRLASLAREHKLSLNDMQGGTFSITNGGVFGSLLSTPIINAPQSAILGMHNIQERPVARNGQVVIRPMMYVALSYDHRIIDGKESVQFLVRIKELIENPVRLLLV